MGATPCRHAASGIPQRSILVRKHGFCWPEDPCGKTDGRIVHASRNRVKVRWFFLLSIAEIIRLADRRAIRRSPTVGVLIGAAMRDRSWIIGNPSLTRYGRVTRHPPVIARVRRGPDVPIADVRGSPEPVPHVESTQGLRRRFKGRDFTATSAQPLRNIPLPHCSRVSQRHFCVIFFSKRRIVFIPSIKSFSSVSFFRDSVCQRSEARVTLRKPKNSRRISSSVKPSRLAH